MWIWKFYRTCIKLHLRHIFFFFFLRKENHSMELCGGILNFCQTEFWQITLWRRFQWIWWVFLMPWCHESFFLSRHKDGRQFLQYYVLKKSIMKVAWRSEMAALHHVWFTGRIFSHADNLFSPWQMTMGLFKTSLDNKLFWKFEMFMWKYHLTVDSCC